MSTETMLKAAYRAVETIAAMLVGAEIIVLLSGVVSRYVLHSPLLWSDELASILFLWLAMLGSVIALLRGEHMRLTVVTARASAVASARYQAVAYAIVMLFLTLTVYYGWEYALDEWYVETPALGLPNTVRAAAIPVGATLMLVIALRRLFSMGLKATSLGCAALGVAALGLSIAQPLLVVMGNGQLILFFVLLLGAAILMSAPIGFAFGTATFAYLFYATHTPLSVVVSRMDEGMSSLILLAVPLFIFLGSLIEITGMARGMIGFLSALVGHFKGGLYYVLLAAMYLVSGISGSKAADMAAIAPVLFPEMKKRGANEGELVAILAASGAMSETIPPSLVLITIGSVTGVSIAALFTGGLLPAFVLAIVLGVVAWFRNRNNETGVVSRSSARLLWQTGLIAIPGLILPVIIRFAVVEGVATATEVSTVGIAYTLLVAALLYRNWDWRRLYPALIDTAALSGTILLIIGTATSMAWALTQSGFSHGLARAMAAIPGQPASFLLVTVVVFIVLGSLLEGIPALVLFGPLLFPIAKTMGINEVHYAMIVILAMGVGLFAPPVGVGYYYACAIGRVSPDLGVRRVFAYLSAILAGLLIIAFVPSITTCFL